MSLKYLCISMTDICIVFVSNKHYFNKFIKTCNELVTTGKYTGNICLIIGDDLKDTDLNQITGIVEKYSVIVKYFPDICFSDDFHRENSKIVSDGRHITKRFQWHKLHLFNTYFKNWRYVFYMDCGMNICNDVAPMLTLFQKNRLLALSDGYPDCERKLYDQFDLRVSYKYYKKLCDNFDLNIDYFQTGIMLYDTDIIEKDTYDKLYRLSLEYPISITNEQGIMALYFTNVSSLWTQLPLRNDSTHFYDYWSRNKNNNYIIVKVKNL